MCWWFNGCLICTKFLITFISDNPAELRSIDKCITLLSNPKLGLMEMFPNVYKLMCVATVLPLSTAEVERVFSQVKLIKNEHRNRLKQSTLENLLHIKLNCDKNMFDALLNKVVDKFFRIKQRRLCNISESNN